MIHALILRELRIASRQRIQYWIRVVGAAAALCALCAVWNQGLLGPVATGRGVFRGLNWLLAGVIWFLAPAMTADCLSREHREGTLPLLFLTSMKPLDILVAKSAVHFLRAGTLLLAALPMLLIPIFMGGITWMDFARSALLHLSCLLLALVAGLVASTWCRRALMARFLGLVVAAFSGAALFAIHLGTRVTWAWTHQAPGRARFDWWTLFQSECAWFWWHLTSGSNFWKDRGNGGADLQALVMALIVLGIAVILGGGALWFGSRSVAGNWREPPKDLKDPWKWKGLTLFRHRPQRYPVQPFQRPRGPQRRDWVNPIAWQQTHQRGEYEARLGWLMGVVGVFVVTGLSGARDFELISGALLLLGMGIRACGSFAAEFETGALELLLISPLKPRHILAGRLRGLMSCFMPAIIAVAVLPLLGSLARLDDITASHLIDFLGSGLRAFFIQTVSIGVMAVVGIGFSFSGIPFAGTLFLALLLVVGLPLPLLHSALGLGNLAGYWSVVAGLLFLVFQSINVWRSWIFAEKQLITRRFAIA